MSAFDPKRRLSSLRAATSQLDQVSRFFSGEMQCQSTSRVVVSLQMLSRVWWQSHDMRPITATEYKAKALTG
jgi:hypothetical protein